MTRGGIDHEGLGANYITIEADATLKATVLAAGGATTADGKAAAVGKAVTRTDNKTAGFGSAGDPLLGRVDVYDNDGMMTVQDKGYTGFTGVSGNLPTYNEIVVVDGNGAIMASSGAVGSARCDYTLTTSATGPVMVDLG